MGNLHFFLQRHRNGSFFNTSGAASKILLTMFWNPMLLTNYLLPFYTVTLLRHAAAHVAQSNQDLDLVKPSSPVELSQNG